MSEAPPSRSRGHWRATATEALGAGSAVALTIASLWHVIVTPRIAIIWYSADSVLLPMVRRGIVQGLPFEWAMSPTLFVFPEIPVYLACAALTSTPQQALALNGFLVMLALYPLLRAVAAQIMPAATRTDRTVVAALAMALVTILVFLESDNSPVNLELASLLLTTTYYYGALLATLASTALALKIIRTSGAGSDRPSRTATIVLGVIAALVTLSNPLYVPWSAGPIIVTAWLLTLLRRVPLRASVQLTAVLAIATVVGYLGRVPFARFVTLTPDSYVKPERAASTVGFFARVTDGMTGTPAGTIELALLFVGVLLGVGGMVWSWRVRTAQSVLAASTLAVVTTTALSVGVIVSGSDSPRYLEPIVIMGLVAFIAVAELVRTSVRPTRLSRRKRLGTVLLGAGCVAALVLGASVAPATVSLVSAASYNPAQCLDRWVGSRAIQGVGQYWTVRPLAAYGDKHVDLLQVRSNFHVYAWLNNLAAYRTAHPTYVIVGAGDVWSVPVEDRLGRPRDVVHCSGYDIWDYEGTPGAQTLTARVHSSAEAELRRRGFPH